MVLKWLFLLPFVYKFCVCTSHSLKSSLTFVIDDTPSMGDDIEEVKRRVNDIFDAVLESEESLIENFVLVTFNSPGVTLWTVTRDKHVFKEQLGKITVNRGSICPASSMSGIELGLKESLPGSYLYVFTDASSRDYTLHDSVKSLALKKSCQIVFALTGMCGSSRDPDYNVFVTLAKATNGQVFHLGKVDVGDLLNYVVESVKGGRSIVTTKEFGPGYGHNLTFSVDPAVHDIILSVSGDSPKVDVKDDKGISPITEHLVDKDKIAIVKLVEPSPGKYTAEVGSKTDTSAVVSAKTTLNFQHGFSIFKPTSLNDTATRPPPDGKSFLMIKLNVDEKEIVDIKLNTVKIVIVDDKVDREIPLVIVDEKQKLYVTESFQTPKTMFKIIITGIDMKTNTTIVRTTPTWIEAQNPDLEIKENKPPTIWIEGEPKVNVEYDEPFMLKCIVNAYPKPIMTWEDKSTGTIFRSMLLDVELPYKYVGIFNIERVNRNNTYECTATNDYGVITKSIEIETKRKIYFNALQIPKDTTIAYKGKDNIACKIDAYPPATITWYQNDEELHSEDYFTISDDKSELIIPNMQPHQRGRYKCVAKNEFNENVYKFVISISGVEPPKIDKHVLKMNVTRGKDVDILCSIIQGIPKPRVDWFYRISKKKFRNLGVFGERFHMKKVIPKKSGQYKCQAVSVMGKDFHFIDLTVEYPPTINHKHEPKVIKTKAGERVTLNCKVDGIPKPVVQWFKNDALLNVTPLKMQLYRDHSLSIKVSPEDEGLYSCKAVNHLGTAKKEILLNVYVPVTIEMPKDSTIDIKVGDELHLPCLAKGYPKPGIKWIHHNIDLRTPPKTLRVTESTLDLLHIQLNLAGYYTCIASNTATSYKISYLVRVLAPPIIENKYRDKTFNVVEGDLLVIACNVTGSPKPVITWKKDGLEIILGFRWYNMDANGALIIKNISTLLEGSYTCEAANTLGRDTELYTVVVAPYPKQEPPKSIQLVERGTAAHITCNVPHEPLDHLRWYKDNVLKAIGELELREAQLSDAGIYTCRVSTHFRSISGHIFVKVGFKPKFTSHEDEVYDLEEEGWSQTLNCDANAEPPAEVSWWYNGKKINVTSMIYTFQAKFTKRGKYYCEVSNDFGTINRTINLRSADCIIDIKRDLLGNQPIMVGSPLKWPEFETTDGFIRIHRDDEYLKLSCPTGFTNFPNKYINAFCEGEDIFLVNSKTYRYTDFKCTEKMQPEVIETREPCFHGKTEWITVGFKVFDEFLSVYGVCLDKENNVPIYAKHSLDRYLAEVEPESSEWMSGDLSYNFEEMYDCNEQTAGISEDLRRFFHVEDGCCFTRRQLVNPRDVPPGLAQLATYHYLNVIPQWSSCGTKNWEEVENRLRTLVKTIDYSLEVVTGTGKPLELPTEDSVTKEIHISDSTFNGQPVSRYLWKVVQDPVTRASLAIIQINIPDLSPSEVSKHVLCKDICNDIKWMKNPDWHDIDKGYTYCCSLVEFEKAFNMKGIFDHRYNRILYDVSMISLRYLG